MPIPVFAGLLFVALPPPCRPPACSCAVIADIREGVRQARTTDAAIFEGRVLTVVRTTVRGHPHPAPDQRLREDSANLITLEVRRTWKGVASDTVQLLTTLDFCTYGFRQGSRTSCLREAGFRLAGPSSEAVLSTGICSYTTAASEGDSIRVALGTPRWERRVW